MTAEDNRLNYARYNRFILTLIPRIMSQVHRWLYQGGTQSLHAYLTQHEKMGKLYPDEQNTIKDGIDSSHMDTTLLSKLLKFTCGLATNKNVWITKPQPGEALTLEKALNQLIAYRNIKSHEDPEHNLKVSDNKLDDIVAELKDIFTETLTLASKKGNIATADVRAAIVKAEKDLEDERHAECGTTVSKFAEMGRQELECRGSLPSPTGYLPPRLLVEDQNRLTGAQEVSCEDLLVTCLDDTGPELLILVGETGTGKTSFCRHVMTSWLKNPHAIKSLVDYQLVLSLHCGEINTRDLHFHLCNSLLPLTTRICIDSVELTRILSNLKVLWVVDGWDEAVPEAKSLIKDLLETQDKSHIILIASRPEASRELLNDTFVKQKSIALTFSKLNKSEKKDLVKRITPQDDAEIEIQLVEKIISSPTLTTPQQLVLMAELLMKYEGELNAKGTPSLTMLYAYISEKQKAQLAKKIECEDYPEHAIAHVDNFFKCICKISFKTLNESHDLKIGQCDVDILKKSIQKGNSSQYFSTFFQYCEDTGSDSSENYSFQHLSQKVFYAAFHLSHICSKASNPESELWKIFNHGVNSNDYINPFLGEYDIIVELMELAGIICSRLSFRWLLPSKYHKNISWGVKRVMKKFVNLATLTDQPSVRNRFIYYSVLLIVLELISDGRFGTSVSDRCLVNLLSHIIGENASPRMWFEVLRSGNFKEDLVKEVSDRVNLGAWYVADGDLRAAYELLQYVAPNEVTIDITEEANSLPDLPNTLDRLAQKLVQVKLYFNWEYRQLGQEYLCEKMLETLCNHKSKCTLTAFKGHLNQNSMKHLAKSSQLQTLVVRVTKKNAINSLCMYAQKLNSLKTLQLIYDLKHLIIPVTSLDGSPGILGSLTRTVVNFFLGSRNLKIDLCLLHLDIRLVKEAVNFTSKLNKYYRMIYLHGLNHRGRDIFIKGLEEKDINMEKVARPRHILDSWVYRKIKQNKNKIKIKREEKQNSKSPS